MAQTVSNRVRAMRVEEGAERRPYVADLDLVRTALEAARVPVTEALLDFHREFAGYTVEIGLDEGVLGLLHRAPSWVEPITVSGYLPDWKGKWMVACADMHPSYEMFLELDGTFNSNGRVASSYFMYTEQLAFAWEFAQHRPMRAVILDERRADEALRKTLMPRLAPHRVGELSDGVSQVFATEDAVAIVRESGFHNVWVAADVTCDRLSLHVVLAELQIRRPSW